MSSVYLSLGSNVGDRMLQLSAAEEKIAGHPRIRIEKLSKVYETEPWPLHEVADTGSREHPHAEEGQQWFLNQVIQIETDLEPLELLAAFQSIEEELGRTEKHHWGDREIDIDLLLYDKEIIDLPNLTIPHRHMADRQFILVPLLELDSSLSDPVSGKSYQSILESIKDDHKVTSFL